MNPGFVLFQAVAISVTTVMDRLNALTAFLRLDPNIYANRDIKSYAVTIRAPENVIWGNIMDYDHWSKDGTMDSLLSRAGNPGYSPSRKERGKCTTGKLRKLKALITAFHRDNSQQTVCTENILSPEDMQNGRFRASGPMRCALCMNWQVIPHPESPTKMSKVAVKFFLSPPILAGIELDKVLFRDNTFPSKMLRMKLNTILTEKSRELVAMSDNIFNWVKESSERLSQNHHDDEKAEGAEPKKTNARSSPFTEGVTDDLIQEASTIEQSAKEVLGTIQASSGESGQIVTDQKLNTTALKKVSRMSEPFVAKSKTERVQEALSYTWSYVQTTGSNREPKENSEETTLETLTAVRTADDTETLLTQDFTFSTQRGSEETLSSNDLLHHTLPQHTRLEKLASNGMNSKTMTHAKSRLARKQEKTRKEIEDSPPEPESRGPATADVLQTPTDDADSKPPPVHTILLRKLQSTIATRGTEKAVENLSPVFCIVYYVCESTLRSFKRTWRDATSKSTSSIMSLLAFFDQTAKHVTTKVFQYGEKYLDNEEAKEARRYVLLFSVCLLTIYNIYLFIAR